MVKNFKGQNEGKRQHRCGFLERAGVFLRSLELRSPLAAPQRFLLLVKLGCAACQLVAPECLSELENHSKFCISLKSVAFRAFCSMLHGFT